MFTIEKRHSWEWYIFNCQKKSKPAFLILMKTGSCIVDLEYIISGGSKNLRTRGAVLVQYNFWGLKIVLLPFTHTLCFGIVRVMNKIHIVNIACWLQWSLCMLWSQNFQKYTHPPFIIHSVLYIYVFAWLQTHKLSSFIMIVPTCNARSQ